MESSEDTSIQVDKQLQTDIDTTCISERQTIVAADQSSEYELRDSKILKPASCLQHVSRNDRVAYIIERREREMLVSQIVELQSTLSDLSLKVDNIKLENFKLRSDNEVLVHYIQNLVYDFDMTQ
ncbi:unnamed protein product [Callosobruchus maculatus]|uniref:Uncharacterized protein n=1 Tax=Callosobruchus maculatus TaxID=64391 RepID=A0A653BM10_CALMS|nr:unnamed protein product [Callosobruchus maculatus]